MFTVAELREKLVKISADGIALSNKGAAMTPEERKSCETLEAEATKVQAEIVELEAAQKVDQARAAKFAALQAQLDAPNARKTTPGAPGMDLTTKDVKRYSLLRAIDRFIDGKPLDGIEGEYNQEITRKYGAAKHSFYMPGSAANTRALDTTQGVGGLNQVVLYSEFIDILRNQCCVTQMGARILSGLVGTVSIPKKTNKASFQWVTDGAAPSGSNAVLGQVQFTEKHLAGYTDITRSFIKQTSMDAEKLVRDDLVAGIAVGFDAGALTGTGSGGQPLGLLLNGGIISYNPESNTALTFADIVHMESTLAAANVIINSGGYLTNPLLKGKLKTTLESSVANANFIWRGDNTVNGYKAMATNQIPADYSAGGSGEESYGVLSAIIMGNWSDLVIGAYGELDILVDPFTGSSAGTVRIVAHQSGDVQLRHNESFIAIKNAPTT